MCSNVESAFFIILFLLMVHVHKSSYVVSDSGEVMVALSWKSPKKPNVTLHFTFQLYEENLESVIWNYCELKTVGSHYCSKLFAYIQKLQRSLIQEEQQRAMINPNYDQDFEINTKQFRSLRNKSLSRFRKALAVEMEQRMRARTLNPLVRDVASSQRKRYLDKILLMEHVEKAVVQVVWSALSRNHLQYKDVEAVAFIHSESYDGDYASGSQSQRELQIILHEIERCQLSHEVDAIFVLHYGSPVSNLLISKYPDVSFVHVTTDTSFSQIPSLRIIRSVASMLSFGLTQNEEFGNESSHRLSVAKPTYVLYMRTLGTDYLSIHPQIEDWRAMLLHFLVEKYLICLELLESSDIDVVSANYVYKPPQRALHGNYWWATSVYLSQLVEIPYDIRDPITMPSQWLFTHPTVRIHILHNSNVNHEFSAYPFLCYSRFSISNTSISYKTYKELCGNGATLEMYALLHNATALYEFPKYHINLHEADNPKEIAERCSSLHLVTVFDS